MKTKFLVLTVLSLLFLVACQDNGIDSLPEQETSASKSNGLELVKVNIDRNILFKKSSNKNGDFTNRVAILNEALLEHGIQLEKMEFLGAEGAGNTVYFKNVRNKQMPSDFVPNDPRNWFSEANGNVDEFWTDGTIPYWTDGSEQGTPSGMTPQATLNAIYSAMDTWGSISCSNGLRLWNVYTTTPGLNDGISNFGDVGFAQFLLGFGGFGGYAPGTILHAGNLSADFFEAVGLLGDDGAPGGGTNILGVTFTFTWGTDIDQNGKNDVGHKEIYINRDFNWQDEPNDVMGNGIVDYETVVLHEAGHGLSQGHFGKAFMTNKNGKEHSAPYALMNPSYSIGQREITGTDNGGHCSNWGEWPNN